jgi:hypothetical protein
MNGPGSYGSCRPYGKPQTDAASHSGLENAPRSPQLPQPAPSNVLINRTDSEILTAPPGVAAFQTFRPGRFWVFGERHARPPQPGPSAAHTRSQAPSPLNPQPSSSAITSAEAPIHSRSASLTQRYVDLVRGRAAFRQDDHEPLAVGRDVVAGAVQPVRALEE